MIGPRMIRNPPNEIRFTAMGGTLKEVEKHALRVVADMFEDAYEVKILFGPLVPELKNGAGEVKLWSCEVTAHG